MGAKFLCNFHFRIKILKIEDTIRVFLSKSMSGIRLFSKSTGSVAPIDPLSNEGPDFGIVLELDTFVELKK